MAEESYPDSLAAAAAASVPGQTDQLSKVVEPLAIRSGRLLAEDILNDWRAAERDLAMVDGDRDERLRLEQEIERLREEYHRLAEEAAREHRVEDVPPFPHSSDGGPAGS